MRVTVLGAGLAGVTAAWYLQEDGHEVTVVERQPQAALETSFANAGLISAGHAFAWASPRAVRIMLKSLFLRDQADPSRMATLVVFESEERARAREQDPRRAERLGVARSMMAEIFEGTPEFTDLQVVDEWTGSA